MARPVNADGAATRQRMLDTAIGLFARLGFDAVSIRRIAEDSGVSLAMVHHYFGGKDALYDACIESMYVELAGMRVQLASGLAAGGSRPELVERAVRTAYRFACDHQLAVRLLLQQVIGAGELDERRRTDVQAPFLDDVSRLIGQLLGRSARELRLPIQSVTFLTARYAISTTRELELLTGERGDDAQRAAEDHLVLTARALLIPEAA